MATVTQVQTVPIRDTVQEAASQKQQVKGGPVIFWLVAGIAVMADIVDIFTSLLDLVGAGLLATVIGAPVGVAIAALSMGVNVASGLFVNFIMLTYFAYIGGSLGWRLVVISIGAIMEMVPGLEILPLTTVMFFLAYFIGKIKIIKTIASLNPAARKVYAVASKL